VTVYATEFHVFAVDFEHLANNLHFLDTCLKIKMFGALFAVEKFNVEGIEIWLFSRPKFRILDVGFERNFNSVIGRDFLYNILIIMIVDTENHLLISLFIMVIEFGFAKIGNLRIFRKLSGIKSRYCAIDCRDKTTKSFFT